jgi:hypothetical protein
MAMQMGRPAQARQGLARTLPNPNQTQQGGPVEAETRVYERQTMQRPPMNMAHSVVLSASEFSHIMSDNTEKEAAFKEAKAHKSRVQQISKNRYQKWGNTLEGQREKRKQDRKMELVVRENKQRELDTMGATTREDERRVAIDHANRMLFKENDRVKSFQSAMLLSTVMQERGRQIDIKRSKVLHQEKMDNMWLQIQNENLAVKPLRTDNQSHLC